MKAAAERDNVREIARSYHEMAISLATQVDDSVARLAGGQAIRDELLGALERQLKGLRSKLEADVELSGLLALLNEKLGDLAAALGRHAEAAAYYQGELARLDSAGSDFEPPATLVRILRKLAGVSPPETERFLERAIAEAQRAIVDEDCRYEVCLTHTAYARYLIIDHRPSRANEHASVAVGLAQPYSARLEATVRWQAALANAYEWQSRASADVGRGDDALKAMRESLRLKQILSDSARADVVRRLELTTALRNFGSLADKLGHDGEAISAYHRALEHAGYLTFVDPSVADWRRELWAVQSNLATLYFTHGEHELADYHAALAASVCGALCADYPGHLHYQRLGAFSARQRGDIAFAKKQFGQAQHYHDLAYLIRESMFLSEPESAGHVSELANSLVDIGNDTRKRREFDDARRYYASAAELFNHLRLDEPHSVSLLLKEVDLRLLFGNLHHEKAGTIDTRLALMYQEECKAMLLRLLAERRVESNRDSVTRKLAACDDNRRKLRKLILHSMRENPGSGAESVTQAAPRHLPLP